MFFPVWWSTSAVTSCTVGVRQCINQLTDCTSQQKLQMFLLFANSIISCGLCIIIYLLKEVSTTTSSVCTHLYLDNKADSAFSGAAFKTSADGWFICGDQSFVSLSFAFSMMRNVLCDINRKENVIHAKSQPVPSHEASCYIRSYRFLL